MSFTPPSDHGSDKAVACDVLTTTQDLRLGDPSPKRPKKGITFWLIFLAIAVSMYEAGESDFATFQRLLSIQPLN